MNSLSVGRTNCSPSPFGSSHDSQRKTIIIGMPVACASRLAASRLMCQRFADNARSCKGCSSVACVDESLTFSFSRANSSARTSAASAREKDVIKSQPQSNLLARISIVVLVLHYAETRGGATAGLTPTHFDGRKLVTLVSLNAEAAEAQRAVEIHSL